MVPSMLWFFTPLLSPLWIRAAATPPAPMIAPTATSPIRSTAHLAFIQSIISVCLLLISPSVVLFQDVTFLEDPCRGFKVIVTFCTDLLRISPPGSQKRRFSTHWLPSISGQWVIEAFSERPAEPFLKQRFSINL